MQEHDKCVIYNHLYQLHLLYASKKYMIKNRLFAKEKAKDISNAKHTERIDNCYKEKYFQAMHRINTLNEQMRTILSNDK